MLFLSLSALRFFSISIALGVNGTDCESPFLVTGIVQVSSSKFIWFQAIANTFDYARVIACNYVFALAIINHCLHLIVSAVCGASLKSTFSGYVIQPCLNIHSFNFGDRFLAPAPEVSTMGCNRLFPCSCFVFGIFLNVAIEQFFVVEFAALVC